MGILKRVIAFLLAATLCFCITGCSDKSEKAYIYFELTEKPTTLDPQTASSDSELLIVKNIFEGLLRKNENGDKVTAYDFEFAFKRAVSSETNSPFVSRLFCISGAENIYKNNANTKNLGVKAKDKYTLQITLCKEDKTFLETLTSSIAMPCNEKFFKNSSGYKL